jgi:LPXTG-motif cell wall-anchored protein
VEAVNAVGAGEPSEEASVTVVSPSTVPGAPQDLDLDAGNGTVSLTWDPPDDDGGTSITGYNVYRGTSESTLVLFFERGNLTHFMDDSVINGQTYYYKVTAVNAVGEGTASDVEHATPTAEGGEDDDDGGDNTMLYIIIGIVALAAVAGVAVFLLKKKK